MIFVAQEVRPDRRIEREAMHAVARRIDEHRRAAIDDIARRHLLIAGLQHVRHRVARAGGVGIAAQNGEDRADADVHVDIARPVERVEHHDVFAVLAVALDDDRVFVLLAGHDRHVAAVPQELHHRLVGDHVELLHLLALDVHLAGDADDPASPARRTWAATIFVASVIPDSSHENSPLAWG